MESCNSKNLSTAATGASTASDGNATSAKSDASMENCLQAIDTLVNTFGFDTDIANQAVDAVGPDVTLCYNYILDHNLAEDNGGPVYPIDDCPHLNPHLNISLEDIPKNPRQVPCCGSNTNNHEHLKVKGNDGSCPLGENWMCLECGKVFCSRYVNGHCVQHWKEEAGNNGGHCVGVSFADLSVWCHECQSYIRNEALLTPILLRLEQYKFGLPACSRNGELDDSINANNQGGGKEEKLPSIDEQDESDSNVQSLDAKFKALTSNNKYPFVVLPKSPKEVADFILSENCRSVVVLAGAGMSVSSGIPDFRSANGLYATMDASTLTATQEERKAIQKDPARALDKNLFLQNQFPCLEVKRQFLLGTRDRKWKATLAHRFVELLHKKTNKLARLYTQNIDGLEDQCNDLPPEKVVNVHGSMDQAECANCGNKADFESFCNDVQSNIKDITGADPSAPSQSRPIPCHVCGNNTLKPAIVLFKDNLPKQFVELAFDDMENVDLLLILGTSLNVAPANSLVYRAPKTCMRVVVNRDPVGTHLGIQYGSDAERDCFLPGEIDATVLDLMGHLGWLPEVEPLLTANQLPESSSQLLKEKLESERSKK